MAILDRPLFQRPLTKEQLRMYGIPAFANGGVVQRFAEGGFSKTPGKKYYNKETKQWEEYQPETAITDLIRPTEPSTGMTIPSSEYEDSTTNTRPTEPSTGVTVSSSEYEEEDKGGSGKEGEIKMTDERMALERFKNKSDFYKSILAKYGEDDMRTQGFLQLAQFGLNLMSQAGSNFLDKVAKSAQDPLKAFADIAARDTQAQKEIDVLALKQVEDDIATEKQNEFELRLQAIKESGKTKDSNIKDMVADLMELFPDKYPDTKEGRAKAANDALRYVEESPQDTYVERVENFKKILLADPGAYGNAFVDEAGNVDPVKLDAYARQFVDTPDAAGATGTNTITTEDFLATQGV